MIDTIPEDVALRILHLLTTNERLSVCTVSRDFNRLVDESFSSTIELLCPSFSNDIVQAFRWLNNTIARKKWALQNFEFLGSCRDEANYALGEPFCLLFSLLNGFEVLVCDLLENSITSYSTISLY